MVHCIVFGCGNKSERVKGIGFYRIPAVITNQGEFTEELTRDRRNEWILAISRDDLNTKDVLAIERVCGKHFVSGKPAASWDRYNVDWKPTRNLGKKLYSNRDLKAASERAERAKSRATLRQEREELGVAEKRLKLNESGQPVSDIDFSQPGTSQEVGEISKHNSGGLEFKAEDNNSKTMDAECQTTECESQEAECQTTEFDYMFSSNTYQAPNRDYFKSDDKVRFYTGLPSFEVLMVVFEFVVPHVTRQTQALERFQEFVMVLIKLRLNVPFQDLAYRFIVSLSTVSRIFTQWMTVMDSRLFRFVYWPDRDQLLKTMPQCFQYAFGKKTTVVIDCFEVFIERPSNLLARAQTFSNYKHHNTIKVLVGITPQGTISYVSKAWGGRTSDKFLTENCGFLEKLRPGDMVMADRGFTITESVGLRQAKLVIPAFTKGKTQLDPVDVEQTRGIANVRIHVEHIIGLLR